MLECVCGGVCYAPSSLLWLTETVSGAGSSTRGGSQCGLSLTWTKNERQSGGHESKNETTVSRANALAAANTLEPWTHSVAIVE